MGNTSRAHQHPDNSGAEEGLTKFREQMKQFQNTSFPKPIAEEPLKRNMLCERYITEINNPSSGGKNDLVKEISNLKENDCKNYPFTSIFYANIEGYGIEGLKQLFLAAKKKNIDIFPLVMGLQKIADTYVDQAKAKPKMLKHAAEMQKNIASLFEWAQKQQTQPQPVDITLTQPTPRTTPRGGKNKRGG